MQRSANINNSPAPQAITAPIFRQAWPIVIFIIGAGIVLFAFGAELIGMADLLGENFSPANWLWVGLGILSAGAIMDLTFGRRGLLDWLKPIVLDWQGLLKFLSLTVQLGLLVFVMQKCYLEHNAFYEKVMPLAFYGFIIHHLLPRQFRLSFFIILSLAGIMSVFGWADSAWLLGLSLLLIGICHLPTPFWTRVIILLVAGVALTAARLGHLQVPWTKAIWPILASMFMFRMIVYLYDLKHKKAPIGLARTLSYFFLLPNVAFPLFPVVDYSTFCRTYYDDDPYRIYQKGLKWIFWGVVHLLIYRYLNYYWVISHEKVTDLSSLIQYMAANYLLIIRLSGQFHLAVGILHLFGFNLPRIMDLYLLATSFTDYWRRVNVYWKEFIQKVFYYPAYFKMRKTGNTTKLVLATTLGFLMTWFFHTYQWFWIQGAFHVSIPDSLFWTSLGMLVLANSLYEAKHGRKRVLGKSAVTLRTIASRTWRAAGIFIVMMILWSMWISPTLGNWFTLLAEANVTLTGLALAVVSIVAVIGAATAIYEIWSARFAQTPATPLPFFRLAAPIAAGIVLLALLVQPEYSYRLGSKASDLIADLRMNRLGSRDAELLERGYYEDLNNVNLFNTQLWELYMQRPDDWRPLMSTTSVRWLDHFLWFELVPSLHASLKDAPLNTNRWGMRDSEYEQTPPPNTFRIAIIGGSIAMGSGVVHEETFEFLLEKRLNRELAGGKYARYEVMNFSVGGYRTLQRLVALETKILGFQPNAVFFVVHPRDEEKETYYLYRMLRKGFAVPYDYLNDILLKADVDQNTSPNKALKRLEPFESEVFGWAYRRVVEVCRQRNITPILVCLPSIAGKNEMKEAAGLIGLAEQAGFVVLNLSDVYDSQKGAYFSLAPWDEHPNARGHRLIANRIYEALLEHQDQIPLAPSAAMRTASKAE